MIVGEILFTTLKMVCYRKDFCTEMPLETYHISLLVGKKLKRGKKEIKKKSLAVAKLLDT